MLYLESPNQRRFAKPKHVYVFNSFKRNAIKVEWQMVEYSRATFRGQLAFYSRSIGSRDPNVESHDGSHVSQPSLHFDRLTSFFEDVWLRFRFKRVALRNDYGNKASSTLDSILDLAQLTFIGVSKGIKLGCFFLLL